MKKIINNISRLQDEKQKLVTKYENALDEIERMKNEAQMKEEMESKLYTTPRRVTVCHTALKSCNCVVCNIFM